MKLEFETQLPAKFLAESISEIFGGAPVYLHMDDENENLYVLESENDISERLNEILAIAGVKTREWDNKQYYRDRAVAYPSIEEQLDTLYWDKINGTDNWVNSISKVKSKIKK
jgi:hypothetical protein